MMAANPAVAIANRFLSEPGATGRLTQMHLQKLAFIAHGWNLAVNGEPLVTDEFQAWDYGPVSRELYNHTQFFGRKPIDRLITPADGDAWKFFMKGAKEDQAAPYAPKLTPAQEDVIRRVWRRYGGKDALELSALTHLPGTPWYETYKQRKNGVIDNALIRQHYVDLAKRAA